jgi:hypothetical protein
MATYQESAKVIVDENKVKAIKTERKKHVVTQSKEQRSKSAEIMERNVEMKKANNFDSLMQRLGVPEHASGETTAGSPVLSNSEEDANQEVTVPALKVESNVLSLNNSQIFERIDPKQHDAKILAKLYNQYEAFVKHVATLENVDTVEMSNCQLTDRFAVLVAEHWINNKKCKLVNLNLETNLFHEDGLIALADAVAKDSSLKTVFLRHQHGKSTISTPAAEAWCRALTRNKTVQKCGLDMVLATHRENVQKCLDRNAEMRRHQRRQKCPAKSQPLDGLERRRIRAVAANDPKATAHDKPGIFCFPDAEKQAFKALKSVEKAELASAFASNTVFDAMDLQSLDLDDEFGLALAETLKTNTTLINIDLSSNRLTSKSLDAIAIVLRDNNRTLKEFKLLNQNPATGIVRASENLLAEAIAQNPVITKLALSKWTDAFARDQVDKKLMQNKWSKKK